MRLDDLVDDEEAQSDVAVVSVSAAGAEGLEQMWQHIETNRLSAVENLEEDAVVVLLPQLYDHGRGRTSMLERVGNQIGD